MKLQKQPWEPASPGFVWPSKEREFFNVQTSGWESKVTLMLAETHECSETAKVTTQSRREEPGAVPLILARFRLHLREDFLTVST